MKYHNKKILKRGHYVPFFYTKKDYKTYNYTKEPKKMRILPEPIYKKTIYCTTYAEFVKLKTFFTFLYSKKDVIVRGTDFVLSKEKYIKIRKQYPLYEEDIYNQPPIQLEIKPFISFSLRIFKDNIIRVGDTRLFSGVLKGDDICLAELDFDLISGLSHTSQPFLSPDQPITLLSSLVCKDILLSLKK